MHNHDPDLISSLAEGLLGAEEGRSAEESIAGCVECSSELVAQRTALAAVEAAPRPGLTMAESTALRRQIGGAVGLPPQVESAPQRRPWLGLATAAAVVVALVAVAPLVNLLSTDSSDATATATTISELEAGQPTESPGADSSAATSPLAAEAPTAEAAPTTAAASGAVTDEFATREGDGSLPQSFLDFGAVEELDEFLNEVPKGIEDEAVTRALTLSEITYYQREFLADLQDASIACPADDTPEPAIDAESIITIGKADFAGVEILIIVVTNVDDTQSVLAIDTATCAILGQVEL